LFPIHRRASDLSSPTLTPIPRRSLALTLLNLHKTSYVREAFTHSVRARAVRVELQCDRGHLTMDGEVRRGDKVGMSYKGLSLDLPLSNAFCAPFF
jgi:hypothetical protein